MRKVVKPQNTVWRATNANILSNERRTNKKESSHVCGLEYSQRVRASFSFDFRYHIGHGAKTRTIIKQDGIIR